MVVPIESPTVSSGKPRFPTFGFQIGEMDDLSHAVLFSRAELEVIDIELDRLIERISATRQALRLDETDKKIIVHRVKHLRGLLDESKTRKKELLVFKRPLRIEEIHSVLLSYGEKLTNLIETRTTLASELYETQRKKTEGKIEIIKTDLKTARKAAQKWPKSIRKNVKDLMKRLNRLEARHRIDDISDREYEESKSAIARNIETLTRGERILNEILSTTEK